MLLFTTLHNISSFLSVFGFYKSDIYIKRTQMNVNNDVNLQKACQILNALLHNVDDTNVQSIISVISQFGFNITKDRPVVMAAAGLKQLAYTTDVVSPLQVIDLAVDPQLTPGLIDVTKTVIWYNTSNEMIYVLNRNNLTWKLISTQITNVIAIPDWVSNTAYPNLTFVIHENIIYRNNSGATITDAVWDVIKWTLVGGLVASSPTRTFILTEAHVIGTTVDGVTRTDTTTWRIVHDLVRPRYVLTTTLDGTEVMPNWFKHVDNTTIDTSIIANGWGSLTVTLTN